MHEPRRDRRVRIGPFEHEQGLLCSAPFVLHPNSCSFPSSSPDSTLERSYFVSLSRRQRRCSPSQLPITKCFHEQTASVSLHLMSTFSLFYTLLLSLCLFLSFSQRLCSKSRFATTNLHTRSISIRAQRDVRKQSFFLMNFNTYIIYVPFTEMILPGIVHRTLKYSRLAKTWQRCRGATHRISNNGRAQRRLTITLTVDSIMDPPNTSQY